MLEPESQELVQITVDKVPPASIRQVNKLALIAIPTRNWGLIRLLFWPTIGCNTVMQESEGFLVTLWCQLIIYTHLFRLIFSVHTCSHRVASGTCNWVHLCREFSWVCPLS